jgi:hypothetical protein
MPPSAMTGTPRGPHARTASSTAVICGMPAPETTRVVQIEPGPMPTLIASAPSETRSERAFAVATLPTTRSGP